MAKNQKVHPAKSSPAFRDQTDEPSSDRFSALVALSRLEKDKPYKSTSTALTEQEGGTTNSAQQDQQPTSSNNARTSGDKNQENARGSIDTTKGRQRPLSADQPGKDNDDDSYMDILQLWRPIDIDKKKLAVPSSEQQDSLSDPNLKRLVPGSSFSTSLSQLSDFGTLVDTDMIFVIKQLRSLKLSRDVRIHTYFKVFNAKGEHVFSAGEVHSGWCLRFSKWAFLFYVFSSDGNPLLTIAQRNESYRSCGNEKKNWLIHLQADAWLNRKFKVLSGEEMDEKVAHTHVSLISGAFLGHIWGSGDNYVIHDIDYNPIISVVRREFREKEMVLMRRSERKLSGFTESLATSCDILYEMYVETTQVGEVCGNVTFREEMGSARPQDCVGATFPENFEPEEKALILAFLLYNQRHDSIWRGICQVLLSGYCISCYGVVFVALVFFLVLWLLGYI